MQNSDLGTPVGNNYKLFYHREYPDVIVRSLWSRVPENEFWDWVKIWKQELDLLKLYGVKIAENFIYNTEEGRVFIYSQGIPSTHPPYTAITNIISDAYRIGDHATLETLAPTLIENYISLSRYYLIKTKQGGYMLRDTSNPRQFVLSKQTSELVFVDFDLLFIDVKAREDQLIPQLYNLMEAWRLPLAMCSKYFDISPALRMTRQLEAAIAQLNAKFGNITEDPAAYIDITQG